MDIVSHVSGVYAITCSVNQKVYIGSSIRVRIRCCGHRNMLRKGVHHNSHLQHAWNKWGEDCFTFSLIEQSAIENLLEREQYWIETYQSCNKAHGYNISIKAGAPMAGLTHSEATKARMAMAQSGRKHTEEVKQKIRAAHLGRKHSPEHREHSRQVRLGRKASPETRAKLREIHSNPSPEMRYQFGNAMRGKKRSVDEVARYAEVQKQEYIVTDPNGNEFRIRGLSAFCRERGLDQGSMSHVVSGRQSTHRGWKCRRPE